MEEKTKKETNSESRLEEGYTLLYNRHHDSITHVIWALLENAS